MATATSIAPVGLFDSLRARETQARAGSQAFNACMAPVASPDSMLYWLGHTCARARHLAGRKAVSVAASVKPVPVDQSTISRFEKGLSWPRDADKLVRAYADDLDIEPVDLWEQALTDWQAHLQAENVIPLDPAEQFVDAAQEAAHPPAAQKPTRAQDKRDRRAQGQ